MKKTPFISILVLLLVIVIAFTGCETTISLNPDDTDAVSTEIHTTFVEVTDDSGEVVATEKHTVVVTIPASEKTTRDNSYVVTVTDENGKVISTEIETLSKDEISKGEDFFNNSPETNNKPNNTDKVTSGKTTTEKAQSNKPEANKPQNNKPTSNKATEKVTEAGNSQVTAGKNDEEVLNSGKFFVSGRIVSKGETSPFKIAKNGQMYTMILGFGNTNLGFIMGETNVYMLLSSEKSYLEIPQEILLENDTDGSMQNIINGDFGIPDIAEVGRTKEKIDGVKYTVVEYEDGTLNYLDGETLVKTESVDGSVIYYDEITSDVAASYFVPPADYTADEFTLDNLNKYTSVIESEVQ